MADANAGLIVMRAQGSTPLTDATRYVQRVYADLGTLTPPAAEADSWLNRVGTARARYEFGASWPREPARSW